MITEDYCSFEVAKLLKEKGFQEPCTGLNKLLCKEGEKPVLKITHQKAMKWLREVHNITIEPLVDFGSSDKYWWSADISYIKKDGLITTLTAYNTYEEAVEEALKYCLENLI